MAYIFYLLGLDTLELIDLGHEKSPAMEWGVFDHEGPTLNLRLLGFGKEHKTIMLPKELLEKLYGRFAAQNPKGTEIIVNEGFLKYAPPGLSPAEVSKLREDERLFLNITDSYSRLRIGLARTPRLYELLPELLDPEVLAHLATAPEFNSSVQAKAFNEGVLSRTYGSRHWRWSPEWAAYVEAYKKAHPFSKS